MKLQNRVQKKSSKTEKLQQSLKPVRNQPEPELDGVACWTWIRNGEVGFVEEELLVDAHGNYFLYLELLGETYVPLTPAQAFEWYYTRDLRADEHEITVRLNDSEIGEVQRAHGSWGNDHGRALELFQTVAGELGGLQQRALEKHQHGLRIMARNCPLPDDLLDDDAWERVGLWEYKDGPYKQFEELSVAPDGRYFLQFYMTADTETKTESGDHVRLPQNAGSCLRLPVTPAQAFRWLHTRGERGLGYPDYQGTEDTNPTAFGEFHVNAVEERTLHSRLDSALAKVDWNKAA